MPKQKAQAVKKSAEKKQPVKAVAKESKKESKKETAKTVVITLQKDHTHKGVFYPKGSSLGDIKDLNAGKIAFMKCNGTIK